MKKGRRGPPALPYSRQWVGEQDIREVARVLRSDWVTQGPEVESFERAFAGFVGARYAVALSSGTAALHAACFAAGLGPGDEALVPAVTFVATANAVVYQGATPVFCDVDPDTATVDVSGLAPKVTARTKAVLPVDFAGHPCDLDPILELAERRGLVVIEDAAHALGARYRGRRVGGIADMTVFSFHPVKHITTGEGGMVATDAPEFARRVRLFRQHGITKEPRDLERDDGPWYYEMHHLGFNYRITDFQCALGASQLKRAEAFIRAREGLAAEYDRLLERCEAVQRPARRDWARHVYHLYPVRLRPGLTRRTRREVFEELRAKGLGVQVHYIPVHLQPYYRRRFGTAEGQCPKAEAFYQAEISLPLFPRMRSRDVRRVVATLEEAVGR